MVLFSVNDGSCQVRLALLLKSWDQSFQTSVWMDLFCLCKCHRDLGVTRSLCEQEVEEPEGRLGVPWQFSN